MKMKIGLTGKRVCEEMVKCVNEKSVWRGGWVCEWV